MINAVVVGHGLAGRYFQCPLIRRQPGLKLHGIVARDPAVRADAVATWGQGVRGMARIDEALGDPETDLVVIATPHSTHADLAVQALEAGKHCVVDKVMALTTADADRMIAAAHRADRMLSVFHNRRWDWDFLTLKQAIDRGQIGQPLLFESAVCRHAPPRTWRGRAEEAGTILHDWGAHLVDQALQLGLGPCRRLSAWLVEAPWEGVTSGGHGRIVMEFDNALFQVETSRICRLDRPRWWVMGSSGGYIQYGVDPQEDALRADNLDSAIQLPEHRARVVTESNQAAAERVLEPVRGSWDAFYANIAANLAGKAPLAVTAEQGREVVRVLEAAWLAAQQSRAVDGPWGGV
ncbi:MAG TPA: Gfo/Idh/MocA family oxidoreductase [Isosphaeraceae bacterium]|jgi:scyllo-inositol 2-dehydrogenase (NADP+)|nr:Gfo/Idh/MocA family oxidoreductase [Isosphaeraceae bacterium]